MTDKEDKLSPGQALLGLIVMFAIFITPFWLFTNIVLAETTVAKVEPAICESTEFPTGWWSLYLVTTENNYQYYSMLAPALDEPIAYTLAHYFQRAFQGIDTHCYLTSTGRTPPGYLPQLYRSIP
jgi:hypothetical protein